MSAQTIVGIDLGTTNSEIAAFVDGRVQVLGPSGLKMLPSCVGLTPSGELLVGSAARNQQLLYPERTVRSIKRKMGTEEIVSLGEQSFTPPEISALILRELVQWASQQLSESPRQAVVTVPAYFSDAQRQATREAGALAGLEVLRVVNEPTAASLAYGLGRPRSQPETVMVYDLGGGTFDVSLVRLEGDVTEVLSSHGNNQLGGDDFTAELTDRLSEGFREQHGVDVREEHPVAYSRLWWAAEKAKQKLSAEPYVRVREENLIVGQAAPLHLDLELTMEQFEEAIGPLVDKTMQSVTRAMTDAGVSANELDAILLVGGATRTPLVQRLLQARSGLVPRQEIHPDLCVALGAGVLASRLAGRDVEQVLVDVTPYSFGISFLDERDGQPYPYCYKPIIRRNSALPITRTKRYYTADEYQPKASIEIFQGEDPDELRNVLVGNFIVEGLTLTEDPNELLCRMKLDLDGILNVSVTEKSTGKSKHVTIESALRPKSAEQLAQARSRLAVLFAQRAGALDASFDPAMVFDTDFEVVPEPSAMAGALPAATTAGHNADDEGNGTDAASADPSAPVVATSSERGQPTDERDSDDAGQAEQLVVRSRELLEQMHPEDCEEAIDLNERVVSAIAANDAEALRSAANELRELLFFVEGR